MGSTGRNEPCPCGSGAKYKHCCEERDKHPYFSRTGILFGVAILLVMVGGVAALLMDPGGDEEVQRTLQDVLSQSESAAPAPVNPAPATTTGGTAQPTSNANQPASDPVPQPPGPAPEGKVWSEEHGHWHDAPTVQVESSRDGVTGTVAPGQPQPGMVWNEEHGHYHRVDPNAPVQASTQQGSDDAPQTAVPRSQIPRVSLTPEGDARTTSPIARPPGPAPEGKVWSYEHGHWHDATPAFPSGDRPSEDSATDTTDSNDPQ